MLHPTVYIPSSAMRRLPSSAVDVQAHLALCAERGELRESALEKPAMRLLSRKVQSPLKRFCRLPSAAQFPVELPARRVG